jgi:hypothetical protein
MEEIKYDLAGETSCLIYIKKKVSCAKRVTGSQHLFFSVLTKLPVGCTVSFKLFFFERDPVGTRDYLLSSRASSMFFGGTPYTGQFHVHRGVW